jgi:hypothetical protein
MHVNKANTIKILKKVKGITDFFTLEKKPTIKNRWPDKKLKNIYLTPVVSMCVVTVSGLTISG